MQCRFVCEAASAPSVGAGARSWPVVYRLDAPPVNPPSASQLNSWLLNRRRATVQRRPALHRFGGALHPPGLWAGHVRPQAAPRTDIVANDEPVRF